MKSIPSIVEFVIDPQLLGLSISPAQETLLRTIYGMPLTPEQREIFEACTGRSEPPTSETSEVTVIAGARSGKDSRIATPIAAYEAAFGGHDLTLSIGETGVIAIVCQDQRATAVTFGYLRGYFEQSPVLRTMLVDDPKAQTLDLVNRLQVRCFPTTVASMRSWSIPVGILNEPAFYRLEGAVNSDVEIQTAMRRGMVGFARTKLVKISTPYMKDGLVFDDFTRAFGKVDPDLLVWRSTTAVMNPAISAARLEQQRRLDPQRFAREFEAEFADDVAAFVPRQWIDAAVRIGRFEAPPGRGRAVAAIDPSGGGADAFTFAVVLELADGTIVQAVMKGAARVGSTAPDLAGLVREYMSIARRYGCREVISDKYAAGWVQQAVERESMRFVASEMDRSQAYLNIEPLLAQGRIELLDHPQMVRELGMLERRPRSGGRDLIEHPRGGHDDYCNALALAAAYASTRAPEATAAVIYPGNGNRHQDDSWRRQYFCGRRAMRRRTLLDGLSDAPKPERTSDALLAIRAEDRAVVERQARADREHSKHVEGLKAAEAARRQQQNDADLKTALAQLSPEQRAEARRRFNLPKERDDE